MSIQQRRTMQEFRTTLDAATVLQNAKQFFARRHGIYSAFVEKEGPGFVGFRGQGGEELLIAAQKSEEATLVTGSTYLFDQQIARFFATLPPAETTVASLGSVIS